MPLDEEGAKWSCEPCIRGHRSSKCQHFDRLMMKVPKAGRPLAKCPHPKGTCSCQRVYAFMVRIPKGSTCLCRPLYQVPAPNAESNQSCKVPPKPISSPPQLPSVGSTSNRVQKRSKRQNSVQSPSESLIKGLTAITEGSENVTNESSKLTGCCKESNSSTTVSSSSMPALPSQIYQNHSLISLGTMQKQPSIPISEPTAFPSTHSQPIGSSLSRCCGKGSSPMSLSSSTKLTAPHLRNSSNASLSTPETRVTSPLATQPSMAHGLPAAYTKVEPGHMARRSNQSAFPADFQLGNTYYSPHFPPRKPETTQYAPHTPSRLVHPFQQSSFEIEGQPGHNCGCGDGCQCLGCASHPFNETTRHYIQEMGYMIALDNGEDWDKQPPSPFNTNNFPSHVDISTHQPGTLTENTLPGSVAGDYNNRPVTTSVPSPGIYGQPNYEMLMQPAAYYTLEYPVGMPDLSICSNLMGTCQCGMDCTCVGCLTHDGHNGVPSPPPDQPNETPGLVTIPQTQPAMDIPSEPLTFSHSKQNLRN